MHKGDFLVDHFRTGFREKKVLITHKPGTTSAWIVLSYRQGSFLFGSCVCVIRLLLSYCSVLPVTPHPNLLTATATPLESLALRPLVWMDINNSTLIFNLILVNAATFPLLCLSSQLLHYLCSQYRGAGQSNFSVPSVALSNLPHMKTELHSPLKMTSFAREVFSVFFSFLVSISFLYSLKLFIYNISLLQSDTHPSPKKPISVSNCLFEVGIGNECSFLLPVHLSHLATLNSYWHAIYLKSSPPFAFMSLFPLVLLKHFLIYLSENIYQSYGRGFLSNSRGVLTWRNPYQGGWNRLTTSTLKGVTCNSKCKKWVDLTHSL